MDLAKKMNAETEAEFLEWLFDGSRLSPETAAVEYAKRTHKQDYLSEQVFDKYIDAWDCNVIDDVDVVDADKKRRRTELDRLRRNGWERVEHNNFNGAKRRRFSYIGPDGEKQTSLKAAMKAIRADS